MNKQLLIAIAAVGCLASFAAADYEGGQYAGLDEQPDYIQQQQQQPLDYNAPAVPAGQAQPGEIRGSVTGHVKNLASVVGQNGKRLLQDAQPVLLGLKSDLLKTKDRISMNPGVVKVKDSLPTRDSIKQTAAPYVAKGQQTINKLVGNIKDRRQRYSTRRQEKLAQRQQQQQQQLMQQEQQEQPQLQQE